MSLLYLYTRLLTLLVVFIFFTTYLFSLRAATGDEDDHFAPVLAPTARPRITTPGLSKELVVASVKGEDVSWLSQNLPDWPTYIYVLNDRMANLTVPVNKGGNHMAFLTYIIDRYDDLPEYMVFIHNKRYYWHNDDPLYDAVPVIQRLRLSDIRHTGYASLRCVWTIGCSPRLSLKKKIERPGNKDHSQLEEDFTQAFRTMFPDEPVPESVGAPCAAQFAVTRDRVWQRSLDDYLQIRKWIVETEVSSMSAGRIMEYTWHLVFRMPPVYCLPAAQCYCRNWGLCSLECSEDKCDGRYLLPDYANVPAGWPHRGGNGFPQPGWWRKPVGKNH